MKFEDLGLPPALLRAVAAEGYQVPTPIQAEAIPHVLDGHDLLGCAQTGTGKTAAFALPILARLGRTAPPAGRGRSIRTLVLSPTRELAAQIGDSFECYGRHTPLRTLVVFGGVNQNPQTRALRDGVDILVATPGRLLDLQGQGFIRLDAIEVFVLDEADRMLDMGFIHDIRKIVRQLPQRRQTLLFSATMPDDIRQLADAILHKPRRVQVAAESAAADNIEQRVYFVESKQKPVLLAHFLRSQPATRTLVFTRTKHGADRVVKHLSRSGIRAEAIHGNKSQGARLRALGNFKSTHTAVLVATDVAARGLDVDDISHVINYDLPNVAETYVHRIGRTARAGASGVAVSFCESAERRQLRAIESLIRQPIPIVDEHPDYAAQGELPIYRMPRTAAVPPGGRQNQGPSNEGHSKQGHPNHGQANHTRRKSRKAVRGPSGRGGRRSRGRE
ncbi:MAG TPA: DEAD/DEAH box helicase [Pirellulales bacterium]|jgi:ATP-dependent RNA helicase RhlE|nr:DEAD/DEAH box helicase [Pirellulales bacterium]